MNSHLERGSVLPIQELPCRIVLPRGFRTSAYPMGTELGEKRILMSFNFGRRNPPGDESLMPSARALARARSRNRNPILGGFGCPIIVEGRRDLETLRALGFDGPIELVNRGWSQSRLIAHLHDQYGRKNPFDGGASVMLMMDWDRTGKRLHERLRVRMRSLDMSIDDSTRRVLMRSMAMKGSTVEGLKTHVNELNPLIDTVDPPPSRFF